MQIFKRILCFATVLLISTQALASRDYISIVGSSTVYPFSTVVAERFGRTSDFRTPKIESTGSGGGFKLFCSGIGVNSPDITNASREIKSSEVDLCASNGITDILEVKIGFDGIVIGNAMDAPAMEISRRDLFLALAMQVPNPDGSETLVDNPYTRWNEINPSLPNLAIEVLGPPPTSGTRDAFAELALEGGCKKIDWIKAMKSTNKSAYKAICHSIREDGAYVEAGENDNLIVQKLTSNPNAFGIFGFGFLDQNRDVIKPALIEEVEPTFENISDGSYPVSRSLYFYVKKAHISTIPGILEFLAEFTSENAMGEEGYLTDKGLIPLSESSREEVRDKVASIND